MPSGQATPTTPRAPERRIFLHFNKELVLRKISIFACRFVGAIEPMVGLPIESLRKSSPPHTPHPI
ncbi:MAG: hypothetical protein F6J93_36450 [Oscillatoria sp. SIO1A7]|nr:hypothetical protein [Oscillatoria sp. SIO1A7]